jgi:hypothetical protein
MAWGALLDANKIYPVSRWRIPHLNDVSGSEAAASRGSLIERLILAWGDFAGGLPPFFIASPQPLSNAFFIRDFEGVGEGESVGFAFRGLPMLGTNAASGN